MPAKNRFEALYSSAESDPAWDAFLESHPSGQFQQSTAWASAKKADGWNSLRYRIEDRGVVCGGFQMLWRTSRLGRIAYISKGPVLGTPDPEIQCLMIETLRRAANQHRLRGLIIHGPDRDAMDDDCLRQLSVLPERFQGVIDATLWFDLTGSEADLWSRMPAYNRTFVRQSERRGVVVREGGEKDLPLFFELMQRTCVRQQETPNPASLIALQTLWRSFARESKIRLTFAESNGQPVAALIVLKFGDRLTLWKKGWTSQNQKLRPNHLLYFEAMCWGQSQGLAFCDFYSVRRDIAESLLRGEKLDADQNRSRDRFHLGFGGTPQLLPRPCVYFPSSLLRLAYRGLCILKRT